MAERRRGVAGSPALSLCVLLLLPAAGGCREATRDAARPTPRNLLIVSLDTVRSDHLSPYGYARDTTPRLAALAKRSVVFDNAFAQETNTAPSHASMFTGVYPQRHGCRRNGQPLDTDQVTLAEILSSAGFRSGAFVSGSPMLARATGLDRGFEPYEDRFPGNRRVGRDTVLKALWWLAARVPGERTFTFVHLYDAHGPYRPTARYARMFAAEHAGPQVRVPVYQQLFDDAGQPIATLNAYVDRYDALLRQLDDDLATLLEGVDLTDTAVVVLSDHGETLGERSHALDHGAQLFDEQIRIPLIVHVPGGAPRREPSLVETVDLTPTLLSLLGVPLPASRPVDGRDLSPILDGAPGNDRDRTFATARAEPLRVADRGYRLDTRRRLRSVRSRGWKLIGYPALPDEVFELYDLRDDPTERTDVAGSNPDRVRAFRDELELWSAGADPVVPRPELDPGLREKLESLGYVGGGS